MMDFIGKKLENAHVTIFDLPGFGNSREPKQSMNVQEYAEWLSMVLTCLRRSTATTMVTDATASMADTDVTAAMASTDAMVMAVTATDAMVLMAAMVSMVTIARVTTATRQTTLLNLNN